MHDWRGERPLCRKPLRVTTNATVWVCCKSLCEVVTHWTGGRTLPCALYFGDDLCELCDSEVPRLKEFWLLVADYRPRGKAVLCKLTPGAIETSPNLLKHDGDLYGRLLYLERVGGSVRSPLIARLLDTDVIVTLPQESEPIVALRRLWNAPNKRRKEGGA